MKLVVIGIDGAAPESLFAQDDLTHLRRLMEIGSHGRLESVAPPSPVPSWMCMATGRDPGTLGVYGPRVRADRSYHGARSVDWASIDAPTIWDHLADAHKRSVVIGVPPAGPPRRVSGVFVGEPEELSAYPELERPRVAQILGARRGESEGPRPSADSIAAASRRRFAVARHFLRESEWDCFQFVDDGLDRLQHVARHSDAAGARGSDGTETASEAVLAHYRLIDEEVGSLFEGFDEETALLVLSTHGAHGLEGGFCVNDWLIREGLLVLNARAGGITPLEHLDVDWKRTTCWGEGGPCALIRLNVKGREPLGFVDPSDFDRARDDIKARLESAVDSAGRRLGVSVRKPEEIYGEVRGAAPDLVATVGAMSWSAVESVGHGASVVATAAGAADRGGSTPHGAFILASPAEQPHGEIEGARLVDVAPTLLELAGCGVPADLPGRSLLQRATADASEIDEDDEERMIKERLSGLGYI